MKILFQIPLLKKLALLSSEERSLTIVNIFLSFGQGLSALFLNIYLWKQTNGLVPVVIFNLFQYPGMMLMFMAVGIIPFRLRLKKILALGFLLYILSYAFLIFAGSQAANVLIPIGILFGIATGIYWSANNALIYTTTTDKNRDNYYAINSSFGSVIAIVSPLIAGIILAQGNLLPNLPNTNYYLLFSLVISIFLLGFYYTNKLPDKRIPKVSFKKVIRPFKVRVWQIVGLSAFIDGIKGGSMGFIATILSFQILTSETNLALYNSIFSIFSVLVSYFLIGRLKPENRLKYGLIGALLFIFVHLSYIAFFSPQGIILSSLINVFANSLFTLGLASTFFLLLDSHPEHKEEYFTYITFREIPLNLGRITGACLFLVLLKFGGELTVAKTWYLLLGIFPLAFYYLTHKFNRIIKEELSIAG